MVQVCYLRTLPEYLIIRLVSIGTKSADVSANATCAASAIPKFKEYKSSVLFLISFNLHDGFVPYLLSKTINSIRSYISSMASISFYDWDIASISYVIH